MQLLRPHCRNVEPPDPGKLQAAKSMLEAADAEAVAAEALPVGSSWPVVSLASTPLLLLPRYLPLFAKISIDSLQQWGI